jgi:hypothetical protein
MIRKLGLSLGLSIVSAALLMIAVGCSKTPAASQVVVEIPSGFSGDFLLEMGVKDAPALERQGDAFVVTVPKNGKVSTSTLLLNPRVTFKNGSDGGVWGYSHAVFSTGDGIPVGGKIEFFVGSRKDYDAEEQKKHHSGSMLRSVAPSHEPA